MLSRSQRNALCVAQTLENVEGWLRYYDAPIGKDFSSIVLGAFTDRVVFARADDFDTWVARMVRRGILAVDKFVSAGHRYDAHGHKTAVPTAESNYRECVTYCSAQLILHKTGVAEMDFDWFNPNNGVAGAAGHLVEYTWYRLPLLVGQSKRKTNPFKIARELRRRDISVVDFSKQRAV